jgi:hypothetical protein
MKKAYRWRNANGNLMLIFWMLIYFRPGRYFEIANGEEKKGVSKCGILFERERHRNYESWA